MASNRSISSPKAAIREFLDALGLPHGLLSSALQSYNTCDSRLWILDNSSSMKTPDAHVGRRCNTEGRGPDTIERIDNVTRWEELQECVNFHANMASRCWIPSKYWLVNDEKDGNHKFGLCWQARDDVPSELSHIKHVMKSVYLDQSRCPLSYRLHSLAKGISQEASHLTAKDKHITVVICTQGLPTDKHGVTSSAVRKEFQQELTNLGKLPVNIIIRLCTDDERVRDMFNTMDSRFEKIDVLDDYWGEALEVYLHNPWLTYGVGLHRLREAGLAPAVIDDLDERPLSLDEVHEFCKMLLVGEDGLIDLPHPKQSWNNFFRALTVLVEKEQPQWNPIKKMPMPWINLKKLDAMHGGHRHTHPRGHSPHESSHGNGHHSRPHRSAFSHNRPAQQHSQEDRGRSEDQQRPHRPRRHTHYKTSSNGSSSASSSDAASNAGKDLALPEVIQRWSHQPPTYKASYSLEHLLVTVPQTFPPTNTKVEPHEYFAKWKTFDREAFADESGDELKELLKRALRKAKFFLHPDKLPKDLTENQILLFRTIWDVLQDREATVIG